MATKKQRLHIHYASQNHFNSDASNISDINHAAGVGADIVAFDEIIGVRPQMSGIARDHGYRAVIFPQGQEVFFVKDTFSVANAGRVQVTPHIYWSSKRYISWCEVNWYGVRIWPHVSHWMIQVGESGHVVSNAQRARYHTKITDAMIYQVQTHGKNPALSFFMGDTNVDEQKDNAINDHRLINYRFNKAGLRTIWDELRVFPPTHGSQTYDMIGKYDPTGRVDGVTYKVWPKLNSDHRPISAYYDITMTAPTTTGTGGATTGTGSKTPATPLKDYKWWDYADYQDQTIYTLPYAIDNPDPGE